MMMLPGWLGCSVCMSQVVEGELARVPPHIARRHSANQQLWSITYLPQIGYAIQVTGQALAGVRWEPGP
ncbi:DNA mismatch repair protein [Haematococcus lacustris]|uniref:DNA mismatch repair protein n=1 Tax=Haematococcus lacustris TaxID=44745 RepID=A0A699YXV6_HAELA|nr:DNA mismatch repair protein [Haematococcus lacustris]